MEHITDGEVGVRCPHPVEVTGLQPHQVVVVPFGVVLGVDGASPVFAVGGIEIAQPDARIERPLAALAEAVLPAQVHEACERLELIALRLPLQVAVAPAHSQSDVPSAEGVVPFAVS